MSVELVLRAGNSPISLVSGTSLISEASPAAKALHKFPVCVQEDAAFPGKIASLIRKPRGPQGGGGASRNYLVSFRRWSTRCQGQSKKTAEKTSEKGPVGSLGKCRKTAEKQPKEAKKAVFSARGPTGTLFGCNGQIVGQPRKRECRQNVRKRRKNVRTLSESAESTIFRHFRTIFAYLVDALVW